MTSLKMTSKIGGIAIAGISLASSLLAQSGVRAVGPAPSDRRAVHLYSAGVDAGDYVYISGQGPRKSEGSLHANFADRVRQALENVQAVVKSAGLDLNHIVYMQVY